MKAELLGDGLALTIARIIAPLAFDDSQWNGDDAPMQSEMQAEALRKAEKILAMDFAYDDLPDVLQDAADVLEWTPSIMLAAALNAYAPRSAELPTYDALVKPMPDGTLMIAVLPGEPAGDDENPVGIIADRLASPEACQLAARVEVSAGGGGQA